MGDLVKTESGGLVSLLHGKGGNLVVPKPFERDIFLFDTYVAGTSHVEGMEELGLYLNVDDKLDFYREPDNPYLSANLLSVTANLLAIIANLLSITPHLLATSH
ncbi:hypothetical protein [Bacillus sp. 1P06AnD]|uniref:hypothetical protein n=1 Tax=Bacillus sp. 1P06AnD TaxID=3132208 RepID=UPI00399F7783